MITAELLHDVFPLCADPSGWATALAPALEQFDINTTPRLASFLAQTGYESGQFNRLIENLNYSTAARLMRVWPRRFPTAASAQPFVGNPQKLANFVYANRLGNGSAASGDGFKYRGRGIIQLTGRSNYVQAGAALGLDLVRQPDLLTQQATAALAAAWFWHSHGLNALADDRTDDNDIEDFTTITRIINGGTTGLQERLAALNAVEAGLA
jgi:putative chitinase